MLDIYQAYLDALRRGDRRAAMKVARSALEQGVDIRDLYIQVFQPALYEIGRLWENNQISVAQEHLATAITQSIMAQLAGSVFGAPPRGRTLVATCLGGEQHEIGMRMVADTFELEGWEVIYLGANVPPDDVVALLSERHADLLAISVTLNSHLTVARELIAAVRATPSVAGCRIMVGGQVINCLPELCQTLGADLTARDAREALERANAALA